MNFWELSAHSERLTLGVKMRSTAAFLSMPHEDGVVMGGKTSRGFNDNTMRGYLLWLPLTTRQVSDVVMLDEDILRAKGGRHVPDNSQEILDPEENRESIRKVCALRYLDGYPDTKVIDPIKENFPACTMPLSSTSPTYITPEIMRNQQYAKECLEHVALIRELLDQSSLSTNHVLLSLSNNRLFQSLSGFLTGTSNCILTMPCAPMPVLEREAPAFMHQSLVTSLTGNQPYYTKGGLIPHLTKKGFFWKSQAPAIHPTMLKYKLHIDTENSAHFDKMDKIDCGWVPPLPRMHHYDGATGLHLSLGPVCTLKYVQYWVNRMGLPPRQHHQLRHQWLGVTQRRD